MRTDQTSRWRPFLFQYSAIDAVFISPYEHFSIIDRPRKSNFFLQIEILCKTQFIHLNLLEYKISP